VVKRDGFSLSFEFGAAAFSKEAFLFCGVWDGGRFSNGFFFECAGEQLGKAFKGGPAICLLGPVTLRDDF